MEIPTESKTVTNRMRREDTITTRSALWALTAITVLPCGLDAQVTRIEIIRAESPTFEGRVFGDVGQYEKLVGVAFGEVAPTDRRNALITDIDLAPRNDRGRVEYETDIYILRPVDTASGNGRLIYGVPNRGGKPVLRRFNNSPSTNDPTAAADAGDGFLMRQGYTIVWSGWESGSVTSGDDRLTAQFPVATNPDGSSITEPHIDEFVFNDLGGKHEPGTGKTQSSPGRGGSPDARTGERVVFLKRATDQHQPVRRVPERFRRRSNL